MQILRAIMLKRKKVVEKEKGRVKVLLEIAESIGFGHSISLLNTAWEKYLRDQGMKENDIKKIIYITRLYTQETFNFYTGEGE